MQEIWVDAYGFIGRYEASSLGNLRNFKTKKVLKPHVKKIGYTQWKIAKTKNGEQIAECGHKLIWESFNEPVPKKMHINHIDGNKTNNILTNLEVVTPAYNAWHKYHILGWPFGTPPISPERAAGIAMKTPENIEKIFAMSEQGLSQLFIAKHFSVNQSHISRILRGLT